jgi:hypothetical protein
VGWLHAIVAIWRELQQADPPPTTKAPPRIHPEPSTSTFGEHMPAYRCSACSLNYKQGGQCRACGNDLAYMTNAKPTPEEELPPEIKAVLPPLDHKQAADLAADWAWLKVEVQRRGGRWTIADLIEEGIPRPQQEAA